MEVRVVGVKREVVLIGNVSLRRARGVGKKISLFTDVVFGFVVSPTLVPRPTSSSSSSTHSRLAPPQTQHRPPIRPIPSISKSKFELEPNPFEQSFSRSSNSIHTGGQSHSSSEDVNGPNLEGGLTTKQELSSSSGSGQKTALPPLSALTSPAPDPANHFSWSGLSSSLRAGPLSPAMLTGPAAHVAHGHGASGLSHGTGLTPQLAGGYDPSTFRTGFTPGSGFTPVFGGAYGGPSSFPMPSPNTAAFLSMVTNSTPQGPEVAVAVAPSNGTQVAGGGGGQQSNGTSLQPPNGVNPMESTITPNTLNALTGVINSMNAANGAVGGDGGAGHSDYPQNGPHQQAYGQPPHPPQHPPHMQHPDSYFAQQQQHGYRPPSPGHPGHMQHMVNGHLPPHMLQPMGPQGQPQGMQPGQPISMPPSHLHSGDNGHFTQRATVAASQAANGLFLLSQAHQELSKREEEMKVDSPRGGKGKRKSEDGGKGGRPVAANKKAKKGSQAPPIPVAAMAISSSINGKGTSIASSTPEYMDDDDADPDSRLLEMAGYDQGGRHGSQGLGKNDQGKPETEEEKRKNFLERNRQGESGLERRTL